MFLLESPISRDSRVVGYTSADSHVCKDSCLKSNVIFMYRNDCAK